MTNVDEEYAQYAARTYGTPAPPVHRRKPKMRLSRKLMLAGVVVLVLGGALSVWSSWYLASAFTVHGSLTLTSSDGDGVAVSGSVCSGTGGYNDLIAGAEVVVTDGAGKTLALGSINGLGTPLSSSSCLMVFTVTGVPGGKSFYGVTVTHRGTVQFSQAQMKSGPELTIGN